VNAWFVVPYKRRQTMPGHTVRYPAIDDFTPVFRAEDGSWSEAEIAGDFCVVRVNAKPETVAMIEAHPGYTRLHGPDALPAGLRAMMKNKPPMLRGEPFWPKPFDVLAEEG
jgi:hypothetical protein